ncbi:hypothetical protein PINS_up000281 [Pythium insidiosum]|nr:hypothetical protein PINS_up000281 [Pythium insidiosum]
MVEVTLRLLRDALRQIAPTIDPKTTTRGMVFARLASLLDVSKDELKKRWKQEIVELITDSLMQEDDATNAETENVAPNASRRRAQSEDDDEEDDDVAPRKRQTNNRSRRVVEAEDDEEDEEEEEVAHAAPDDDDDEAEEVVPTPPVRRQKVLAIKAARKPSRARDSSDDGDDSDTVDGGARKRRRKTPTARPKAAKAVQPAGLVALKEMAQAARLLNPAMHGRLKKAASDEERESILRDVLADKGITFHGRYPKKGEITAVKRKRDLEAEQDGIDKSAILPEGSRRRTRGARPQYNFDLTEDSDSDSTTKQLDDVNQDIHDDSEEKEESDASSEASFKVGGGSSSEEEEVEEE